MEYRTFLAIAIMSVGIDDCKQILHGSKSDNEPRRTLLVDKTYISRYKIAQITKPTLANTDLKREMIVS